MNIEVYKAYRFAKKAHKGQVDKAGKKYISHPLRVSKRVKSMDAKIVALLHDVVEDTKYTLDDIEKKFGKNIAHSVKLLTHDENVSYEDYIDLILTDKTATEVKMSDLLDNMNNFRMPNMKLNDHIIEKHKL